MGWTRNPKLLPLISCAGRSRTSAGWLSVRRRGLKQGFPRRQRNLTEPLGDVTATLTLLVHTNTLRTFSPFLCKACSSRGHTSGALGHSAPSARSFSVRGPRAAPLYRCHSERQRVFLCPHWVTSVLKWYKSSNLPKEKMRSLFKLFRA